VEQIDNAATLSAYDNMNRLLSQIPGGGMLFRGTVSEPATVTVAGQPATVDKNNQFSATVQVTVGTNQVTIQAKDPSGNSTTKAYQLAQAGSARGFGYDANGNLSSDGTKTYEWDAENRLTAVKQAGSTLASFTYDGQGRRASKTSGGVTTTYIYEGSQFLEERPGGGESKRYVYGPGIDHVLAQSVGGVTSYFAADHLGSVVRTTDTSGAPILTREYDPWGNLLQGSTTSGYVFTGREWDAETGLYYYRARYYDPTLGRFTSEDPKGLSAGSNLYEYARNNPVRITDPFGLEGQPCWDKLIVSGCTSCSAQYVTHSGVCGLRKVTEKMTRMVSELCETMRKKIQDDGKMELYDSKCPAGESCQDMKPISTWSPPVGTTVTVSSGPCAVTLTIAGSFTGTGNMGTCKKCR
jgi:RHS repeat-associated protein